MTTSTSTTVPLHMPMDIEDTRITSTAIHESSEISEAIEDFSSPAKGRRASNEEFYSDYINPNSNHSNGMDLSIDLEFPVEASYDELKDPLFSGAAASSSIFFLESGVQESIQELHQPKSAQSTPSRRPTRSWSSGSGTDVYKSVHIQMGIDNKNNLFHSNQNQNCCVDEAECADCSTLPHGRAIASDHCATQSARKLQYQSQQTSLSTPQRKRCYWSLWIFRSLIVLADVVLFLVMDDSASSTLSQAANPQPLPIRSIPHVSPNSNHLSHARAFEAPEFRLIERLEPLERYVMEESPQKKSSGWVISAVFMGGVCLEIVFKEVFIKRRDRQRKV